MSRLKIDNQWEVLSYNIGGVKVPVDIGGDVAIAWPDGEKSTERYVPICEHVPVVDMGRFYNVERYRLFVVIDYHGVEFRSPIDNFNVREIYPDSQ